jgi:Domain of unknown function (DUF4126)
MDSAAQYALAYALTTTTGIRALLPLALVSLAVHFGYLHEPAQFHWLGSNSVTLLLVAVAVAEMLADKIPLVDHALHFVQVATKPAAAAILVAGTAHPQSHDTLVALMVLGALNALGVHAFTSSARVASTATTGGIANPLLSGFEDAAAIVLSVLAFVAPFIAAVLCVVAVVIMFRLARRVTVAIRSRSGP